jgi:hypothetical protein
MTARRVFSIVALLAGLVPRPGAAAVSTAEPAALLVFPLIRVSDADGVDTRVQLTNTDTTPVAARCLYQTSGAAPALTPFLVHLAAAQPVAWSARHGLAAVPGGGDSLPPLSAGPLTGALRCLAVDAAGVPSDRNVLVGNASVLTGAPAVDTVQYNAVGVDALPGGPNGDDQLQLGGPAAEYAACPASLVLQSFFDGAVLDLGAAGAVHRKLSSELVLVTCAHSASNNAGAVVDFALTNELGTQFTFSRSVTEQLASPLSSLDSADPSHSIFAFATQGTPAGAIAITPHASGSGVLALAVVSQANAADGSARHAAAVLPQLVDERSGAADVVDLTAPTPACVGDCDGNGTVAINELILGVNIALGNQPLSACTAFDPNRDGTVAINELIAAVNNALGSC